MNPGRLISVAIDSWTNAEQLNRGRQGGGRISNMSKKSFVNDFRSFDSLHIFFLIN